MYETIEETLRAFCDDYGYEYRENYSGRGMYGRNCVGIVCECSAIDLIMDLADYIMNNFDGYISVRDALNGQVRQDSMGIDTIVYFPGIES